MNKGFFLNYADTACLHGFLLMGRGIVGREGGREGGREVFCVVRFHRNILRRNRDCSTALPVINGKKKI